MKQTAVEWLLNQMDLETISKYDKQLLQAKVLEKQQIIDAWDAGISIQDTNDICSEYYYNQTYKEDKQ